jgi:transcriptional regulator with XRE-family HTH domain
MPSQLDKTDEDDRRLLAQETLLLEAQEMVVELMQTAHMNRGQLARALGKSNGFVTQLLSGERNMTLRTLADLAGATGHRVELRATPSEQPKRYPALGTSVLNTGLEDAYRNMYMQFRTAPGDDVQIVRATSSQLPSHLRRRRPALERGGAWSTHS